MSFIRKVLLLGIVFWAIGASFGGILWAEGISPAQEQEFIDARTALESAQKAQADKYALADLKQAEESLQAARNARQIPDPTAFSRSSMLARAYAELAESLAVLQVDTDQLAATQEAIQKAKAEIEQMKAKP